MDKLPHTKYYAKRALLSLLIPALMTQNALADEVEAGDAHVNLDAMTVTVGKKNKERVGEKVVSHKDIKEQLMQNSHDLVRYNTEVDVAEVGRYGNKGFAVRGVDGNRVAMSVDGIALPEAEANEIFSPYGYMYEGRFNPDLEMMGSVRVTAGADSVTSGSGAVGGAVSYTTKEPSSLIRHHEHLGGYAKVGYANKNEEFLKAVGLAGVWDKAEFILNYSRRDGHETKNHAMRKADNARLDPNYMWSAEEVPVYFYIKSLIYPNPMDYKREAGLAKFYYHITPNHRLGAHGLYQKQTNFVNTDSTKPIGGRTTGEIRRAHDKEEMKSYGVDYRYQADEGFLDTIELDYTHSEILGLADTWVYDRSFLTRQVDKLDYRAYRPTNTDSDQYSLSVKLSPFDFGRAGEHTFSLNTRYNQQDYTLSALDKYEPGRYRGTDLSFAFPDAKKDNFNISIADRIYFGERLNAMLGVRYDSYKYKPYFQDDVEGFSENARNATQCNNGYNTLFCQRYRNGQGLENTKFDHVTYSGLFDYKIIPDKLTANYKIGTGFLAPTVTQIYSSFQGLGARQVPNYNLKPETSFNQELEFVYTPTSNVLLSVAGYHSKYDDFIHTKYWTGDNSDGKDGCERPYTCLQSTNLDDAKVTGLKLGAKWDMSAYLGTKGRVSISADYHTAKDKAKVKVDSGEVLEINTLAAVPTSFIFGTDYVSADETWQLHSKMRFLQRKNPKDTKTVGIESTGSSYTEFVETYKYANRGENALIFDLYGSKKFNIGKAGSVILNAGVYNITDKRYIPWETLRQFNNVNTNSMVDMSRYQQTGYGFARYTAPGRNYAVSLTYEF